MKTVVTGGAGFIGSHLVDRLIDDGHEVRILDSGIAGHKRNLEHLIGNPNLNLHQVDVTETETILRLFENVDWVFHMAALADIVPSIENPLDYHRSNVDGTVSVLEAARHAGVKRFIYSASSSCYGIPDTAPPPETAPIRAMYPYALTKYLGEQYVLHWNNVYQLPSLSLRLFNVFGPRSRTAGAYGAVFGVFLAQKLAGQPFTVVGDGTQSRDFTFVDDVVECFVRAAESSLEGEVLNVGSGATHSINDLVTLLDGPTIHIPKRPGEPDRTFADIKKIKDTLGWEPKVSFEDGVKQTVAHIEDWRNSPVWTSDSISEVTSSWFTYLGNRSEGSSISINE